MSLRSSLSGKLLNVATNMSPPYVILEYETQKREWIMSGGLEKKLLETLSEHFNFTYNIINCNRDWGIQLPNNTWTGIIGKVVSKLADIGFAGLSITNARSQAVDFTNQHIITSVTFITSSPKTQTDYSSTLLIQPFEPLVWISLIIAFILMSLNEWLIFHFTIETRKILINNFMKNYSLKRQIICLLPSVGPLKMITCCWILSCLVLTSSYSGCLYSLMTVPSRMKTINSIEELAIAQRKGEIKVLATKGSSYYQEMKSAESGIHREIGSLIETVDNKIEGFDVMKDSTKPHAFILTKEHLIDAMLKFGEHSFYLPPQTDETVLNLDLMGIALKKKSEYKKPFDKFISKIQNGGFLEYWRQLEIKKLGNTQEKGDLDFGFHRYDSINLNQLQSAFYFIIIGISITLILFLIEIFHKYFIFLFNNFE